MISSITIEGLGPTEAAVIDLDPNGLTIVSGESECGKSTLLEAVCFALWGRASDGSPFPVEAVRDGWPAASVEVVTAKGTRFRRTLTRGANRKRSWAYEVQRGDVTDRPTTDDAYTALLGPLADAEIGRLILVPFAWQKLVEGEGGGRPFANLIARLLPPQDLRAIARELMAPREVRDSDSLDEEGVKRQRADVRRHADATRGKRDHLLEDERSAAAASPVGPSDAEVAEARSVLDCAQRWSTWRELERASSASAADRQRAEKRQAEWDARLAALGPETPEPPEDDAGAADEAMRAYQASIVAVEAAESAEKRAAKAWDRLRAGSCPTCGSVPTAEAVAAAERALTEAQEARERGKVAHEKLAAAMASARAAFAQSAASARAWREAAKRRRELGPRPELPEAKEIPPPPPGEEPAPEAVSAAKTTISDAERAIGAGDEQERRRTRIAQQLDEVETELSDAEEEHHRLELLIAAVRRAPSEASARQLACLGDLGPVTIQFPSGPKAEAIRVLLDGRPWWCASTGRQIVGDVWLRAALRRMRRWPWMPIVVDRVQDVAGQDVPECRPAIWLRTCDGPLTVEVQ